VQFVLRDFHEKLFSISSELYCFVMISDIRSVILHYYSRSCILSGIKNNLGALILVIQKKIRNFFKVDTFLARERVNNRKFLLQVNIYAVQVCFLKIVHVLTYLVDN